MPSKKDKKGNKNSKHKQKKISELSEKKKKNKNMTPKNNNLNNYFSSIRLITSINNDLDILSNNLDLKFKNNSYFTNIFPNINSNNYLYMKEPNLNINSYYDSRNNSCNNNLTKNKSIIKVMDNLYLYKNKTIPQKIYRQPELIRIKNNKNIFKTSSFHNFRFQNRKYENYSGLRNILFPIKSPFSFRKTKDSYINNINNACKILLEKE